jgi:hypothetical protein
LIAFINLHINAFGNSFTYIYVYVVRYEMRCNQYEFHGFGIMVKSQLLPP